MTRIAITSSLVLAAMLLPALASAKSKAKQANCSSNLRQIGNGYVSYIQENQGWLPYVRNYDWGTETYTRDTTGHPENNKVIYWFEAIAPYIGIRKPPMEINDSVDLARRKATRQIVNWVFDNDFDPDNGLPSTLGPGPRLSFTGGIPLPGSDFVAGETVTLPPASVPALDLQLNPTDLVQGDMVSGVFSSNGGRPVEGNDYQRNDFVSGGKGAFLVRLRRTGEGPDRWWRILSSGP